MGGKRFLIKGYYIIVAAVLMVVAYVIWHMAFSYEGDSFRAEPVSTTIENGAYGLGVEAPSIGIDDSSALIRWKRIDGNADVADYVIYVDGKVYTTARKAASKGAKQANQILQDAKGTMGLQNTSILIDSLDPRKKYTVEVRAVNAKGEDLGISGHVQIKTLGKVPIVYASEYGLTSSDTLVQTKTLQKAIDETPAGAKLVIPPGTYRTGALFLHSYMTLELSDGTILRGSDDSNDFINSHAVLTGGTNYYSLLNMRGTGGEPIESVRIVGSGILDGNGWQVGTMLDVEDVGDEVLHKELPGETNKTYTLRREEWFDRSHQMIEDALGKGILSKNEMQEAMNRGANLYRAYGTRSHGIYVEEGKSIYMRDITIKNSPADAIHIRGGDDIILWNIEIDGNHAGAGLSTQGHNMWLGGLWINNVLEGIQLVTARESDEGSNNIFITSSTIENSLSGLATRNRGNDWIQNISMTDMVVAYSRAFMMSRSDKEAEGGVRNVYVHAVFGTDIFYGLDLLSYSRSTLTPRLFTRPNLLLVDYIGESRSHSVYRDIHVTDSEWIHMGGPALFVQGSEKGRHKNVIFKRTLIDGGTEPIVRWGDHVKIYTKDEGP